MRFESGFDRLATDEASDIVSEVLLQADTLLADSDVDPENPLHLGACRQLVTIVKTPCSSTVADAVLRDPAIRDIRPLLNEAMSRMEFLQELYCVRELLRHKTITFEALKAEPKLFYEWYEMLVSREIELSRAGSRREVAFIGSGPVAFSALLLSTALGGVEALQTRLSCWERDEESFRLSTELVDRIQFEGLEINCADGRDADLSWFSTVIIASLAHPIDLLLAHLRLFPNVKNVIVRASRGLAALLYRDLSEELVEASGLKIVSVAGSEKAMNASYLLRRQ